MLAELPTTFIQSSIPTRKEYEASLLLSDERRRELEAEYLCATPPSASSCFMPWELAAQERWSERAKRSNGGGRRRSDSRRSIIIGDSEEHLRSTAEVLAQISPDGGGRVDLDPQSPKSPSFRTKQLTSILQRLQMDDDDDHVPEVEPPPENFKRRGRGAQSGTSVLASAGVPLPP